MGEHGALLRFEDEEHGRTLYQCQIGIWPPPERIWLVQVDGSDFAYPISEEELAQVGWFWGDVEGVVLTITPFRQYARSKLPDDTDFTHVMRGAAYVPEMDS